MKTPIIFDVDTGIDDAVALMWAISCEKLDIKFIATCTGNTTATNAVQNTLNTLEMINAPQIDVVKGSEKGFLRTRERTEPSAHGSDGLGDYEFPPNTRKPCKTNYLTKYINTLEESTVPVTIIVLGPLTNIANLLEKKPEIAKKIKQIYFMGSSLDRITNDTPYAGFNVACDPEAVEKVLQSKVPIVFCPNNLGKNYFLSPQQLEELSQTNRVGKILCDLSKRFKDNFVTSGMAMFDSATVFAFLYPNLVKRKRVFMDIKYFPKLDTAIAIPHFSLRPNAKLVVNLKGKKFYKLFFEMIKKFNDD